MSATFNWAYKGNTTIQTLTTSFIVAASADGDKPANAAYVALHGNDTTGNGSRLYPFKTITKGLRSAGTNVVIVGSGVYRERPSPLTNSLLLIGDGDVIIDGTGQTVAWDLAMYLKNLTFRNANGLGGFNTADCSYCTFMDMALSQDLNNIFIQYCKFIRISSAGPTSPLYFSRNTSTNSVSNNTFIDCADIRMLGGVLKAVHWNNIFVRCNIGFTTASFVSNSIFYNCNFRFNQSITASSLLYPNIPSGYSQYSSLSDLQGAHLTAFPSAVINFPSCMVVDPVFNNGLIDDYTLTLNSPAKNLSFQGTFIGAHSIAHSLKIRASENEGAFEFSTAINVNIANDSITLTNPSLDAQIDTKVIVNILGRELTSFRSYGFNADRNGQYIDSLADLAALTKTPNDTLSIPTPYLVEGGAIVYNGITYTSGSRFTTIAGQTSFTTSTGAVLREILEAPQRHTIMARFSDGGSTVATGEALVTGNYYYVQTGSVTYENKSYNTGDVFKAVNTNTFSGQGTVIVAFSAESYQHFEPGIRPTTNNTGNLRTGAIIRGNGDPAYVRGGLGVQEFPVNAKFIQIRYQIKANNLKP